jgi:nitrogen regulatory protein PII
MKKIEAIIRPEKFDTVITAIVESDYSGITITKVMSITKRNGHGNQKGIGQVWRGRRFRIDLLSKIKLEIIANDNDVENIVNTIINESQTRSIGDGEIFIFNVENVYRVRTNESGMVTI